MAAARPDDVNPIVLDQIKLPSFIQYMLDRHTSVSSLIICQTEIDFLRHVTNSIEIETTSLNAFATNDDSASDEDDLTSVVNIRPFPRHALLRRTIQLIQQSQDLQVAFCPSLQALHAYLSVYSVGTPSMQTPISRQTRQTGQHKALLGILGLVELHEGTPSFSAQGLSRTMALAIEASHRNGQQLVIAECHTPDEWDLRPNATSTITDVDAGPLYGETSEDHGGSHEYRPWMQDIPILNATTRTFGPGDRGWVGRTVKVRDVMERWCTYEAIQ